MCGRFYIESDDTPEELMAMLNHADQLLQRAAPDITIPRGEVRPGDTAAVMALNRKQQQIVFPMRWGFRYNGKLIINARSETASERPMFRQSYLQRRCLIPASAYFEWDHSVARPDKYRFFLPDARMLYLAGLYRYEAAHDLPVFTVLTRSATDELAVFHDRMPVILPPAAHGLWLNPQSDPADVLARAADKLSFQLA